MCRHFPDVKILWRVKSAAQSSDIPSRLTVLISILSRPSTPTTMLLWSGRTVCSCPRKELHFSDGESSVLCSLTSVLSSLLSSGPPRPPSSSPPRMTKMFMRYPLTTVQTVSGHRGTLPTLTLPMPRDEAAPLEKIPDLVKTLSYPAFRPTSGL